MSNNHCFKSTVAQTSQLYRLGQRILQIPDVLLYGFQALWDRGGRLVCRHARYWNLWDRASKQLRYHYTIPTVIAAGECSPVCPPCTSLSSIAIAKGCLNCS